MLVVQNQPTRSDCSLHDACAACMLPASQLLLHTPAAIAEEEEMQILDIVQDMQVSTSPTTSTTSHCNLTQAQQTLLLRAAISINARLCTRYVSVYIA